jgi:hypothetical protein
VLTSVTPNDFVAITTPFVPSNTATPSTFTVLRYYSMTALGEICLNTVSVRGQPGGTIGTPSNPLDYLQEGAVAADVP